MEKKELPRLFQRNIEEEYQKFKSFIIEKKPDEIFESAYEISSMKMIYEIVMSISQQMKESVLQGLIHFPSLLAFLYHKWLKIEDSQYEELYDCIRESLNKLEKYQEGED